MRTKIQKFGKTLMGPLSIIVASGLLLGIVSILQNPVIVGDSFVNAASIQYFVKGVNAVVGTMFSLLPMLFAISVAIGLAKDDKEYAGFAVVIGFFIFHIVIQYILSTKGITPETTSIDYLVGKGMSQIEAFEISNTYEMIYGVFSYRMGIFGGIIVGLWTAMIHNHFHTQKLPVAFSFFAGNRFVPIMMVLSIPILSIATYFIWPYFAIAINGLGSLISKTGNFGLFLYGFSERLLIPTGLHHILNQLIRFTPIGGTAVIDGETVSGALTIFNSALASPTRNVEVLREATRFLTQGTHAFMIFGLPAACYAMYKTSFLENKPKVKAMLLAAALTSFFTGITEPIEFSFIFISPILWLFHATMAGLSFVIMSTLKVAVGNAGGGFIDLAIFGIAQGSYTRWYIIVIVGIIYGILYYFVFKYVIEKYDLETPGREKIIQEPVTIKDLNENELGSIILKALGGIENIEDIDNCISRMRLVLKNVNDIDEELIKTTGSMGIIKIDDHNLQIIYGGRVEEATRALKRVI